MTEIFLGLGSNLGDRHNLIQKAIDAINDISEVIAVSELYETKPYGFDADEEFINCCLKIQSDLSPHELLEVLRRIEIDLGREQKSVDGVYKSRTIDIDILFYGSLKVSDEQLVIPHHDLHNRMFVIQPLNDIAPDFNHPILNESIKSIFNRLSAE